ncbi:MAG: AmmeMemoRadiSam system protein A [Spirochaetes bacterium]|nr:AmmeMemoRadiSam system protein A [Spirochaetota bacterium]
MLNDNERQFLLKTVRSVIRARLDKKSIPQYNHAGEHLLTRAGIFVTLHLKNGSLRGCIGYIEGIKPLIEGVVEMAQAAAFQDPRFPPLEEHEYNDIVIEITVLSPLIRINDPDEIIVGKHGLVITKGFNHGLLLPQVPVEQGWDRDTFISHTCMKAGLSPDAWKRDKLTMEIFEGEVFGER